MKTKSIAAIVLGLFILTTVSSLPTVAQLKQPKIKIPKVILDNPNDVIKIKRDNGTKINMATTVRVFGKLINGQDIKQITEPCNKIDVTIDEWITYKKPDGSYVSNYKTIVSGKAKGINNQTGCTYDLSFEEPILSRSIITANGLEKVKNGTRKFYITAYKPATTDSLGQTNSAKLFGGLTYQESDVLPKERLLDVVLKR